MILSRTVTAFFIRVYPEKGRPILITPGEPFL